MTTTKPTCYQTSVLSFYSSRQTVYYTGRIMQGWSQSLLNSRRRAYIMCNWSSTLRPSLLLYAAWKSSIVTEAHAKLGQKLYSCQKCQPIICMSSRRSSASNMAESQPRAHILKRYYFMQCSCASPRILDKVGAVVYFIAPSSVDDKDTLLSHTELT